MNIIAYSLKGAAVAANCLFFAGVYYGRVIYNKKFKGRRIHNLAVGLGASMGIYLIILIYYMVSFLLGKYYLKSGVCLFFIVSPFTIGLFGNNYDKAKTYFNIQLLFLALSLLFIVFFV